MAQNAPPPAPPPPGAPAVQQPPAYGIWRKTIQDYTRGMAAVDGSNKAELRAALDTVEALRQWTALPDNIALTMMGFLTTGILRSSVLTFLTVPAGGQNQPTWITLLAHITTNFLEQDEPDYQRRELEKIQQGTYEDVRDYGQHYLTALNRAYTAVQLQDPLHHNTVMRCYVRGLQSGDIREKIYDSNPNTLDEAMTRALAFSRSKVMRGERNARILEADPTTLPPTRVVRREEPMDVNAVAMEVAAFTPATPRPTRSPLAAPPPPDLIDKKIEALDGKVKGLQKQLTALTKGQEEMKTGMKGLQDALTTVTTGIKNTGPAPLPATHPQALYYQTTPWYPPHAAPPAAAPRPPAAQRNRRPPQKDRAAQQGSSRPPPRREEQNPRPDRRKWDDNGVPYCLKCGGHGHMMKDCSAAVVAAVRPQSQGN